MDGSMAGAVFTVGFLLVITRVFFVASAISSLAGSTPATRPQAANRRLVVIPPKLPCPRVVRRSRATKQVFAHTHEPVHIFPKGLWETDFRFCTRPVVYSTCCGRLDVKSLA